MKLLVDTDAFCKLAVTGLFHDAAGLLGVDLPECGRLPALPYMLQRGRLRRMFGPEACDALLLVTDTMPVVVQPCDAWLDKLTPIEAIDPGEAQIFAAAAESGLIVLSGDLSSKPPASVPRSGESAFRPPNRTKQTSAQPEIAQLRHGAAPDLQSVVEGYVHSNGTCHTLSFSAIRAVWLPGVICAM